MRAPTFDLRHMLALISIGVASFGGCIISGDDTSKGGAAGSPQEYMGTCGAGDEPGSESAGKGGGATKGGSAGQAQAGALSTAGAAGESTMGGESHGSGGASSASAGEAGAGGELTCPSYLQTDTVYQVYPLNRPEMWCVALSKPIVVSCSMLLNPELTVPTAWGETKCVKKDATYYWAGTTLPKADGWQDCTTDEASFVDKAVDCDSLK